MPPSAPAHQVTANEKPTVTRIQWNSACSRSSQDCPSVSGVNSLRQAAAPAGARRYRGRGAGRPRTAEMRARSMSAKTRAT